MQSMAFHDDDDKDKDLGGVSEDAIGEVLDKDEDEDEVTSSPLDDDEKAWE